MSRKQQFCSKDCVCHFNSLRQYHFYAGRTVSVKNARVRPWKSESNFNNSVWALIFMRKRSILFFYSLLFISARTVIVKNDLDFDCFFKAGSYTKFYFWASNYGFFDRFMVKLTTFGHFYDHNVRTKRSFTCVTGQQNPVRLYIFIYYYIEVIKILILNQRLGLVMAKFDRVTIR